MYLCLAKKILGGKREEEGGGEEIWERARFQICEGGNKKERNSNEMGRKWE